MDAGKTDIHPLVMEDCPRCLMQWWFYDADGARRCVATELILPTHLDLIDKPEGTQHP